MKGLAQLTRQPSTAQATGIPNKSPLTKLGDTYEKEADKVADYAVAPAAVTTRRLEISRMQGAPIADAEQASTGLAEGGQTIEPPLRQEMEEKLGYDFARVRLHSDAGAITSARDLGAKAFTIGDHVFFGANQYAADVNEGRRLLAHELTHVIQQDHRPIAIQRAPIADAPPNVAEPSRRYNLQMFVPHVFQQAARTYSYANQTAPEAIGVLAQFRDRMRDIIDEHKGMHRELRANREEHDVVGFWSDTFGGVDLPDYEMWDVPQGTLHEVKVLLDGLKSGRGNPNGARQYFIEQAAAMTWRGAFNPNADPLEQITSILQAGANQMGECVDRLIKYKEGTEAGAERGITVCKVSIAVLSAAAGGEAFAAARGLGLGIYAASGVAAGTSVVTAEAAEIGGQVGEMRYGERKWGDFDYSRIAKVGVKNAVTGFIGALAGGKLSELAAGAFTRFAAPYLARLGFNLNNTGLKLLGGLGLNWITTAGSVPFTTTAGFAMDRALGLKSDIHNWGDFLDQVLEDMKHGVEMGTFLHLAGITIQARGGTTNENIPNEKTPTGGGSGGDGGGKPAAASAPDAVDPYARTQEMDVPRPQVQRGNAAIASARTLRPGELEAQTSPTQQHPAVEQPVNPHARTQPMRAQSRAAQGADAARARTLTHAEAELGSAKTEPHQTVVDPRGPTAEVTPDSEGAYRGNNDVGRARTLTPEQLAREHAKTQVDPETTSTNPKTAPSLATPAPLPRGPIHDAVAASQALANAVRTGQPYRLINDADFVRDAWQGEGRPGEEAPLAWVDKTGKLNVDTTRVRPPLRSRDVLVGPVQEPQIASEGVRERQTQPSIPPRQTQESLAPTGAKRGGAGSSPPRIARSRPAAVAESINDARVAQEMYWRQHRAFNRGQTHDVAQFTTDRQIYEANWQLGGGKGKSPPGWVDDLGRLQVDATRVDIHNPPPKAATPAPAVANESSAGRTTAPSLSQRPTKPEPVSSPTAKLTAPANGEPSQPKLVDDSVAGELYRVRDASNPKFYAQGRVGSHNELEIDLRAELPNGERSAALKGAEQFHKIIDFFRGRFSAIKGNWQFGTNLDKVNQLTGQGMSLEAAAAQTWTAAQARGLGFVNIRILGSEGTPGAYKGVKVLFEPKSGPGKP